MTSARRPRSPEDSSGNSAEDSGRDVVPVQVRAACAVVAVEAVALLVVAVVLVVKALTEDTHRLGLGRGLSSAGLAMVVVAVLVLGGRGLLRLRPAARTPVVLIQLLALPVSYTMAFQANRPAWGGPILLAALAVLFLLFSPPARDALDRQV